VLFPSPLFRDMGCDFYLIKCLEVTSKENKLPIWDSSILEIWRTPYYDHWCGFPEESTDQPYDPYAEARRSILYDQCVDAYKKKLVADKKSTILFQDGEWVSRCKRIDEYRAKVERLFRDQELVFVKTYYYTRDR